MLHVTCYPVRVAVSPVVLLEKWIKGITYYWIDDNISAIKCHSYCLFHHAIYFSCYSRAVFIKLSMNWQDL